jgi:serine protease Do
MNDNFENVNTNEESDAPITSPESNDAPMKNTEAQPEPVKIEKTFVEENSYGGFSNKWAYEKAEEKAKKKGRGIKIFAAVMSALFLITLTAFATYFIMNEVGKETKHDFYSEYTPEEDRGDDKEVSVNASIDGDVNKAIERDDEKIVAEYTGEVLTRRELIAFASPSVVGIKTQVQGYSYFGASVYEGVGSGFIITESGYIVTNHHVIEDAMAIKVILENGNEYDAVLVGNDELSDLAVLKIEPQEDLKPVVIGDSDKVMAGDSVIAIGCPAGIEFAGTATSGMISMAKRELSITDSYGRVQKTMYVIQIDAPINPGNSGGPLLNDRGEVIGINTLKLSSTGYEGIGFALPMNGVMDIVHQLCEDGVVSDRGESSYVRGKAALGITYNEFTEQEAKYYQIPRGVLVILATPGGAAQKYGVKGGDIITALDDWKVVDADDLISALNKCEPGQEVVLSIWRDGEEIKLDVVLGESSN